MRVPDESAAGICGLFCGELKVRYRNLHACGKGE